MDKNKIHKIVELILYNMIHIDNYNTKNINFKAFKKYLDDDYMLNRSNHKKNLFHMIMDLNVNDSYDSVSFTIKDERYMKKYLDDQLAKMRELARFKEMMGESMYLGSVLKTMGFNNQAQEEKISQEQYEQSIITKKFHKMFKKGRNKNARKRYSSY